jgi:hypothetical protein
MKKTGALLVLLVFAFCVPLSAQEATGINNQRVKPQSTMFVELAGQGLAFTFNGDFRLSASRNNMGVRVGIGYISTGEGESILTVPLGFNFLFGKNEKYFEMGLGITFASGEDIFGSNDNTVGTMFFGYRSQPEDGGFNFRAGLAPIFNIGSGEDSFFIPYWPGISFGYTFE